MTLPNGMAAALRLIAGHHHAGTRVHSFCEPLGEVAANAVSLHPDPGAIESGQIDTLYAKLIAVADPEDRTADHVLGYSFAFGGLLVNVTRTAIRISTEGPQKPNSFSVHVEHSSRLPGLHGVLKPDEGAPDRALAAVRAELAAMGHAHLGSDLQSVRNENVPVRGVTLTRPAPEDPDEIDRHHHDFGHASDWNTARLARKVASAIVRRWRIRGEIRARLDAIVDEARAMIGDIPEMDVLKASVALYSKPGYEAGFDVHVHLRMLGNGLQPELKNAYWSRKDVDRFQMKLRIKEHRKRLAIREARKAEKGDTVEVPGGLEGGAQDPAESQQLGIAPILAYAILNGDARYAAGILQEIESEIAGRHRRPSNPRKRGITDITVRDGRVNACVNITSELRYERDRVTLKTVNSAPETLLNGIRGIDMRRLIDHPAFDGLTAKSATVSLVRKAVDRPDGSRGYESIRCLKIRPEQQSVPLAPVLDHLRRIVAKDGDASGESAKKTKRSRAS